MHLLSVTMRQGRRAVGEPQEGAAVESDAPSTFLPPGSLRLPHPPPQGPKAALGTLIVELVLWKLLAVQTPGDECLFSFLVSWRRIPQGGGGLMSHLSDSRGFLALSWSRAAVWEACGLFIRSA